MERLTNKQEADSQRRNYEKRLEQGYPRNVPEERFLRLAAYEDLEEQGRLVVLPCKVGDTVYKICPISRFIEIGDRWDGRIVETDCQRCAYYACDCHNIGYNKEARNVVVERRMSKPEQIVRCMPYFGTIYFLTREEAETALNQRAKQTTGTEEQE